MQKPTIIFDMDGTLLDLAYDDFIWNELLPVRYAATHGCSMEHSQTTLSAFYQEHNHTLNWYSSRFWTAKVEVDVLAMQIEHKDKVALRPYCLELLDYLKTNGYPIWLATNADCAGLAFKLDHLNLSHYFDVIVSSETIGHAKEFVEFWQGLNAMHPFDPQHAYFIDDTEKVLNGAKAYGIENLLSIQQPSSAKVARETCNYPMLHQLTDLITYLNQAEVEKNMRKSSLPEDAVGMRIDKWLWAARFFKTRSIAKHAIEGGKVHHNGERVKVSREVRVGMELTIQQGIDKKTVLVKELSDVRGPAPVAQKLYEETEVSIARRELITSQRKLHNLARPDHRPSKKDRRDISKFKNENSQSFDQSWSYNDD